MTSVGHAVAQGVHDVNPGSVRVLGREAGRGMTVTVGEGVLDVGQAREIVGSDEEVGIVADAGPRGDLGIDLGAQVVLLVHVGADLHHALLAVILAGEIVLDGLCTAAHAQTVVGGGMHVIVHLVPPVGVGIILILAILDDHPGAFRILGLVVDTAEQFHHIFLRVVHVVGPLALVPELVEGVNRPVTGGFPIGGSGGHLHAPAAAVSHAGTFIPGTVLGSDQDDTVSSAGAVYGGGRGVLDHGDGGHVLRIDAVDAALHAVDEHQRVTAVDRGVAADVEAACGTGVAAGSRDVQARDRALQHSGKVVCRTVLQLLALHRRDGAGEVHFLLGTIAHDHGLLEGDVVLLESDVDSCLVRGNRNGFRSITEAGNDQDDFTGGNLEVEGSIHVRYGAGRRSFQDDAGAEDGKSFSVEHPSGYRPVLCGKAEA